jgi:RNA polymerase sigma-70 factor (ECF subfamily)
MVPSHDDAELLLRFAHERDQAAFAALVRRYANLVYSAAVRRVGNRHLAEDVTQAVFVILSKKAKSISSRVPLSAWLLRAVAYCSSNALKIETRRRRRERAAAEMATSAGAASINPSDVLVWQEISDGIDDAVLKLPDNDRRAVLLRYYEARPIREIAQALNVSEDAAKQRVSRAVDKLRTRLDRQGTSIGIISAASLATLLATNLARAAPPALIHTSCAAASAVGASASATSIAKGAIAMMTYAKTKIAAVIIAGAVLAGAGGVLTVKHAMAADETAKADASASDAKKNDPKKNDAGVTIENAPPVIIKSEPAAGSKDVDPNLKEIKITFSKDMMDKSWSWAQMSDDTFPKTTGKPHYEDDHRTCVLPVTLEPGKTYILLLNKPPYDSFMDKERRKAIEYWLVFETKK